MRNICRAAWMSPVACLLIAFTAQAGNEHFPNQTSRTYFGMPGALGETKEPNEYHHVWAGKVFGVPFCNSCDAKYDRFLRNYQIEMARHEVRMKNLNWDGYDCKNNPKPNNLAGFFGKCNCNDGGCNKCKQCRGYGMGGGGCASGNCGGGGFCSKCGHKGSCSSGRCMHCGNYCGGGGGRGFGSNGYGFGGYDGYGVDPRGPMNYPAMNREDALRYIEGFQYYPPNQSIRSPRDFFMWDTTKDVGR